MKSGNINNPFVLRIPVEIRIEVGLPVFDDKFSSVNASRTARTESSVVAEATAEPSTLERAYSRFDFRSFRETKFNWGTA